MKLLGNIIWFIFVGLWAAIGYVFLGLLLCITVIGIPSGMQLFKMASLVITPFGHVVDTNFGKHPIINIIWLIFAGIETALGFLVVGLLFCVTVIGIPFGMQCFKLAKLTLIPFGAALN
jgi:uncharacterized membrane protein YccF (DUF307 family)